ncbi:hypothetical protein Cni_G02904 [Canna indica]|uniref:Uncharacterized protein n=1 Tax=Canna indica TaxID=4628 RepID=A0AAQ3JS68_9LILI|nr:hypothetical protein Cni_G02904 [Canna indica]
MIRVEVTETAHKSFTHKALAATISIFFFNYIKYWMFTSQTKRVAQKKHSGLFSTMPKEASNTGINIFRNLDNIKKKIYLTPESYIKYAISANLKSIDLIEVIVKFY